MSTKISQFDTATEVNNLTYVAAVVDNEDGTFTNKKVPYAILPHDLQSVTDAGNRTTTNITVGGDPGAGEQGVTIKADGVYFLDPTIGQTCHLQVPAGISDIDVMLPSSAGTLARLEDVATPTLDAVLTEGNISAQPVFINDGAGTGSSVRTDGIFSFTGNVSTEIHPTSVVNSDTDSGINSTFNLSGTQIATSGDQQAAYQLEKWKLNDTGISSTGDATGNAVVGADGVNTKQASESFSVLNADGDKLATIRGFDGLGRIELGNGNYITTIIPDTQTISHVQTLPDRDGMIMLKQNIIKGTAIIGSAGTATVNLPENCTGWSMSLTYNLAGYATTYGILQGYISTGPNRLNIVSMTSAGIAIPGSDGAGVDYILIQP